MPQSALSQVPGRSAPPMVATTGVGASAGTVFPCRVHLAQTDRTFGASECENHLHHPVPRRLPNVTGNGGRSQAIRRIHRLPGGAPHLGSEPASASPSACIVPGGGISPDGSRWIACRKDSFFLPYLLLSQRFRKKFLWQLRQALRHGALRFTGELRSLASPTAFEALCEKASKIEWVVHSKPPFGGPQRVLRYLARYTHRVAISNHRLRALENGRVSFEWKDYAHHGQRKIMTLDALEFIRRFLLHVLPSGLVRIRQFGFLANRFRTRNLQLCRDLLAVCQTPAPADSHNPADSIVPDR